MVIKRNMCFRALLTSVFLFFCYIPLPFASHIHCKTEAWSLTHTQTQADGILISGGADIQPPDSFIPNSTAECIYELSDISSLKLKLTFTNSNMLSTSGYQVLVSLLDGSSERVLSADWIVDNEDEEFFSGVQSTILFVPHTAENGEFGGPPPTYFGTGIEFDFQQVSQFAVDPSKIFVGNNGDWTITDAEYLLEGYHYYLPVPEPSTVSLMFSFLLLFHFQQRFRRK